MTMSSLARIPLTSLFTAVDKSELCSPEFSAAGRCRFRSRKWACNSSISTGYGNGGIVCKAASVEPRAVIEGLSIAEDVSQVKARIFGRDRAEPAGYVSSGSEHSSAHADDDVTSSSLSDIFFGFGIDGGDGESAPERDESADSERDPSMFGS